MSATFSCDGCGVTRPGFYNGTAWFKPLNWFARNADNGKTEVTACSRECIKVADEKRGESVAVLPL